MQEHAHGIHAQLFRPAEFQVNPFRIKRVGLPHFEFVDGVGRNVIAPHQPRLRRIPISRGVLGPALVLREGRDAHRAKQYHQLLHARMKITDRDKIESECAATPIFLRIVKWTSSTSPRSSKKLCVWRRRSRSLALNTPWNPINTAAAFCS